MDYYTYGNADVAKMMFDSIAMATGANSSFSGLASVTALLAFAFVLGYVIWRQNFMVLGGWFFGIVFIWYGFFLPKTNVTIVDQTNPTSTRVVSNMPLGIAIIGNITSSIGKWFVDINDVVFSPINDTNYSKTGLVFGANTYRELSSISLQKMSPELQNDLAQYMANCSFYDITLYKSYTVDDLMKSTDILTLIGNTKQALSSPVYDTTTKEYKTLPCNQAYASIKTRFNAIAGNSLFRSYLSQRIKGWYVSNSAMPLTYVNQTMTQMEASYGQIFSTTSRTATNIIGQHLMINALKMASLQNAQMSGSQQQMSASIAGAQAEMSLLNQQSTAALVASKYLPIMHNVIEAILLALFPMVIIMSIMAGLASLPSLLNYATTLLWVKLWPGMFAMVNGIASMFMVAQARGSAGGMTAASLSNSIDMLSTANATQAFAGYLTMLVPPLAWGLVQMAKGGVSSAFSQATSSAGSTAQSEGGSVGAGRIDVGNAKYNTQSGNVRTDPSVAKTTGLAGTTTSDLVTGQSYFNSSLPVSASSSLSNASAFSARAAESRQLASSYESQMQQASSAVQSNTWRFISSQGSSYMRDLMSDSRTSAGDKATYSQIRDIAKSVAQENGIANNSTTQDALAFGLSVGMGTKGAAQDKENAAMSAVSQMLKGAGVNGRVNEQVQHISQQSISTAVKQGLDAIEKSGISFSSDVSNQVTSTEAYRNALSSGNQYAAGLQASQQQLTSATIGHRKALSEASSIEQSMAQEMRKASQVSVDYGVIAAQILKDNPSMSLDNTQGLQQFGGMLSDKMGVNDPRGNSEELGGRVQSSLSNGASSVESLYRDGNSKVGAASASNQSAVKGLAGGLVGQDIGSGFQSFGQGVQNRINQTGQKVQTGDYNVAQEASNIYAKGAAIAPTDTQKAMNMDGSSFGFGNSNSPMDMSEKLSERSKQVSSLGDFNYLSGDQSGPKHTEDPARTKDTLVVDPPKELRRLPRKR